jgi:aspartyl aminopeptidase
MEQKYLDEAWSLLSFIAASPTQFHAVDAIEAILLPAGFRELSLSEPLTIEPGGKYYVTKNRSTVIAFRVPSSPVRGCMISAAHTDSPTFRLKPDFELKTAGYLRLSTERYGGMILSSWLDRPLSVAGRVILRDGESFVTRTVSIDRDLLIIPNVAIHFNRKINEGYTYNPASDMLPLAGAASDAGMLRRELAETLGVSEESIVSADLSLYDRTGGTILGLDQEFFSAPRIDNLECSYATLRGFLEAEPAEGILTVYASFDNEEVGSMTKQGADSPVLFDLLGRIATALGGDLSMLLPSMTEIRFVPTNIFGVS